MSVSRVCAHGQMRQHLFAFVVINSHEDTLIQEVVFMCVCVGLIQLKLSKHTHINIPVLCDFIRFTE